MNEENLSDNDSDVIAIYTSNYKKRRSLKILYFISILISFLILFTLIKEFGMSLPYFLKMFIVIVIPFFVGAGIFSTIFPIPRALCPSCKEDTLTFNGNICPHCGDSTSYTSPKMKKYYWPDSIGIMKQCSSCNFSRGNSRGGPDMMEAKTYFCSMCGIKLRNLNEEK